MPGFNYGFGGINGEVGGIRAEFGGINHEVGGIQPEFGGIKHEVGGIHLQNPKHGVISPRNMEIQNDCTFIEKQLK